MRLGKGKIPLWFKIAYTLMVLVIIPVYWHEYGVSNFLWFSDIALFVMVVALWLENRFLSSMMAVGVLPLEIIWMAGFLSGGALFDVADYMFDDSRPLFLRSLSLFHFPMPLAIILILSHYGYDRRAIWAQIALALVVLPLTYVLTEPEKNINWVFGPDMWQHVFHPVSYLLLYMAVLVGGVYAPVHLVLRRVF